MSAKGEIFSKLKFVEFWQSSEFVKILSAKGEVFSKLKFVEFWQSSEFLKMQQREKYFIKICGILAKFRICENIVSEERNIF